MYQRMRTSSGRRYNVRMAEDEKAERILYWAAITVLTFIGTVGMLMMWMKGA